MYPVRYRLLILVIPLLGFVLGNPLEDDKINVLQDVHDRLEIQEAKMERIGMQSRGDVQGTVDSPCLDPDIQSQVLESPPSLTVSWDSTVDCELTVNYQVVWSGGSAVTSSTSYTVENINTLARSDEPFMVTITPVDLQGNPVGRSISKEISLTSKTDELFSEESGLLERADISGSENQRSDPSIILSGSDPETRSEIIFDSDVEGETDDDPGLGAIMLDSNFSLVQARNELDSPTNEDDIVIKFGNLLDNPESEGYSFAIASENEDVNMAIVQNPSTNDAADESFILTMDSKLQANNTLNEEHANLAFGPQAEDEEAFNLDMEVDKTDLNETSDIISKNVAFSLQRVSNSSNPETFDISIEKQMPAGSASEDDASIKVDSSLTKYVDTDSEDHSELEELLKKAQLVIQADDAQELSAVLSSGSEALNIAVDKDNLNITIDEIEDNGNDDVGFSFDAVEAKNLSIQFINDGQLFEVNITDDLVTLRTGSKKNIIADPELARLDEKSGMHLMDTIALGFAATPDNDESLPMDISISETVNLNIFWNATSLADFIPEGVEAEEQCLDQTVTISELLLYSFNETKELRVIWRTSLNCPAMVKYRIQWNEGIDETYDTFYVIRNLKCPLQHVSVHPIDTLGNVIGEAVQSDTSFIELNLGRSITARADTTSIYLQWDFDNSCNLISHQQITVQTLDGNTFNYALENNENDFTIKGLECSTTYIVNIVPTLQDTSISVLGLSTTVKTTSADPTLNSFTLSSSGTKINVALTYSDTCELATDGKMVLSLGEAEDVKSALSSTIELSTYIDECTVHHPIVKFTDATEDVIYGISASTVAISPKPEGVSVEIKPQLTGFNVALEFADPCNLMDYWTVKLNHLPQPYVIHEARSTEIKHLNCDTEYPMTITLYSREGEVIVTQEATTRTLTSSVEVINVQFEHLFHTLKVNWDILEKPCNEYVAYFQVQITPSDGSPSITIQAKGTDRSTLFSIGDCSEVRTVVTAFNDNAQMIGVSASATTKKLPACTTMYPNMKNVCYGCLIKSSGRALDYSWAQWYCDRRYGSSKLFEPKNMEDITHFMRYLNSPENDLYNTGTFHIGVKASNPSNPIRWIAPFRGHIILPSNDTSIWYDGTYPEPGNDQSITFNVAEGSKFKVGSYRARQQYMCAQYYDVLG